MVALADAVTSVSPVLVRLSPKSRAPAAGIGPGSSTSVEVEDQALVDDSRR